MRKIDRSFVVHALRGRAGHIGLALVAAGASFAACTTGEQPTAGPAPQPQASSIVAQASEPAADPALAPSPAHATTAPVTGTVAETMEAANYTYVRLTTSEGDQWAAVPQAKLAVGDTATIMNPMVIEGFQSPTLKRKFDRILFGTLAGQTPPARSGNPHAGMAGMGMTATSAAPAGPPVPKATGPNAHTIAEILASKGTLKDKQVTVRGRVTKYNGAILGKNWLHLEDGSVKAPGDDTLVVTSAATANVGDVVVVQGVVHTDRDFGAGYVYPVMIEEASITK